MVGAIIGSQRADLAGVELIITIPVKVHTDAVERSFTGLPHIIGIEVIENRSDDFAGARRCDDVRENHCRQSWSDCYIGHARRWRDERVAGWHDFSNMLR